jgi:RHS repeat-associated protein
MQQLDYDEYGNVTGDTNPGFQPFGFMGGLHDADTGLVTVGHRNYDAEVGRPTVSDPIRFGRAETSLHENAVNDPINLAQAVGWQITPPPTGPVEGSIDWSLAPTTPIDAMRDAIDAEQRHFPGRRNPFGGAYRHCVAACLLIERHGKLGDLCRGARDYFYESGDDADTRSDLDAEVEGTQIGKAGGDCEMECLRRCPD